MKLRDFEYSITIERHHSWSSHPVTVCAILTHPDGEKHHIYFHEHEPAGPNKAFWSTEYGQLIYNNDYVEINELRSFYCRIYATRIAGMLQQ